MENNIFICDYKKNCNCLDDYNIALNILSEKTAGVPLKRVKINKKNIVSRTNETTIIKEVSNQISKDTNKVRHILNNISSMETYNFVKQEVLSYFADHNMSYMNDMNINNIINSVLRTIKQFYLIECKKQFPILKISNNNKYITMIKDKLSCDYENLVDMSILQSSKFTDIENKNNFSPLKDLIGNYIEFDDANNLVDPVILALFGSKLQMLEKLIIQSDTYDLINSIVELNNDTVFQKDLSLMKYFMNELLFKTRLSDTTTLTDNSSSSDDEIMKSEMKRTIIHSILRKVIFNLRQGKFNSTSNNLLTSMLQNLKIKYNGYTSTPAGMLDAILRVVSFFPTTLVYTGNTIGTLKTINVPYYNYKLGRENSYTNLNTLSTNYFNTSIPNPSVINIVNNLMGNEILNNIMPIDDACRKLIYNPMLDNKNASLLSSNGILVLNVDRFEYKQFMNSVNLRNIEPVVNGLKLQGKNFNLKSAVLVNDTINNNCLRNKSALNYYTLLRLNSDKWFKYDPSIFQNKDKLERLKYEEIKKYLKNKLNKPNITDTEIREAFNDNCLKITLDKMLDSSNNKFSVDTFIKSYRDIAFELGTRSVLLIYSEDYINLMDCNETTNNFCDIGINII